MPVRRIPLTGSLTNRNYGPAIQSSTDQQFINCFPAISKNQVTGEAVVQLTKRDGYATYSTLAATYLGNIGAFYWSGADSYVFSVSKIASAIVRVYDIFGTQIGGDITNSYYCISLTETKISGVATLVAYVTNNAVPTVTHAWYYQSGGAWTQITDADFPPNFGTPISVVGDPVHINGVMISLGTDGKLYNSDLNSLANWTSTSFLEAQRRPDAGVWLQQYRDMVVAFGIDSIEFFQYSGNATGSVLTRIPGAVINIGVDNTNITLRRVLPVGDTLYFIGHDRNSNAKGIYRIDGTSAVKVSNRAVDDCINAITPPSYLSLAGVILSGGMSHVLTSIAPTTDSSTLGTYAYCIETGVWWRFKFASAIVPMAAIGDYMTQISNSIVYIRSSTFKDDGTEFPMTIQTGLLDFGTDRLKEINGITMIADTQTTAGSISVSWSNDDYANFSSARSIDMTKQQKKLGAGLGWCRQRSWKLSESIGRPFRGRFIDIEYTVSEE